VIVILHAVACLEERVVMVVLVVEDSGTMRQLLCAALRRIADIVVVEGTDGADALNKLRDIKPDVIMTDLNMPIMGGFEFIQTIRERPDLASIPIIVLTTEGAKQDQDRAKELGVTTYVTKPIRPNDVVSAVNAVLEKR